MRDICPHTETLPSIMCHVKGYTINREHFDVKMFSDSMAYAKIKYMRNINDNAVQGRLSENYLLHGIF